MKILAYLITRLAKRVNPKIKFSYLGDSIGWGYLFVNLWISITLFDLIVETVLPGTKQILYKNKLLNPVMISVAILMIFEFFIFFSKDQWKEFIPAIAEMDRIKRKKLCWRVIWFLIIAVPLSLIALFIKYPMLTTWTG